MDIREKIQNRSAKIGVVGLGYVGLPLAVLQAKTGYHVFGVDEVEWAEEGAGGIGEGDAVGPGNVEVAVRGNIGIEEDLIAVINGVVIEGVLVPFGPPAGVVVRGGAVIGVATKKMNVIKDKYIKNKE